MIGLTPDVKGRENPVCLPLLCKDLNGPKCKQSRHYCSIVGLMSYLQGSTQPETAMTVHQYVQPG
eukprot:7822765-Ditylum_brightwellii.AAC.1